MSKTRVAVALLALVLGAVAIADTIRAFPHRPGIDYYHLWGIPLAHAAIGGDPYTAADAYSRVLDEAAACSSSPRLQAAHAARPVIDPTGTPLFYAVAALLPRDYDTGSAVLTAFSLIALVLSVAWLAHDAGTSPIASLALGAAAALLLEPFARDLDVGNVNALQLAGIVAAIRLISCSRCRPLAHVGVLPLLAPLVAFKPNTALIAAALAVSLLASKGPRAFLRSSGLAVGALAIAWLVGALYFGSAAVWTDWYRFLHDMPGGAMMYAVGHGNVSLVKMLSEQRHADPYAIAAIAGLVFILALGVALARGGDLRSAARERMRDPAFMGSAAVLLTFATSPLLWPHYEVWALLPIAYVLRERRADGAATAAILGGVLMSRPLATALDAAGLPGLVGTALMMAWLPLVLAFCLRAARQRAFCGSPSAIS